MKRSKTARLVLMAAAPIVISACGSKQESAVIYANAEECVRDGQLSAATCAANYRDALTQHQSAAPQYASRSDCEADFGSSHCESNASHGGSFMPMMMGFMAANAMQSMRQGFSPAAANRQDNCATPPCPNPGASSGAWRAQPLYRSADDRANWRTADNTNLGPRSGAVTVDSAATRPAMAKTLSRGGFGAQAATRSAFSSGG